MGRCGGRHHFTALVFLRHNWNIIFCLLTFKSCSAAVVSIGLAAISVKCPLATLLLLMEDFLFPSMATLLYFAPSLNLLFCTPHPLKPGCCGGWKPLALRKWATTGDAVGQRTGWKTPFFSFWSICIPSSSIKKKIFSTFFYLWYCCWYLFLTLDLCNAGFKTFFVFTFSE